jgi:hypothetical protein
MAKAPLYDFDGDCSLDLAEAISLLDLIHFAAEHADNEVDWFSLRSTLISSVFTAQTIAQRALRIVEARPPRAHSPGEARQH